MAYFIFFQADIRHARAHVFVRMCVCTCRGNLIISTSCLSLLPSPRSFFPRLSVVKVFSCISELSGFAAVSKDMTSSRLIGPLFVRRYPDMPSAADVVNTLDQQALASILLAYGEERHARRIASSIVEARRVTPIARTQQLASVVAGSPATSLPISLPRHSEGCKAK